jgi:hypothetical protein
MDITLFTPYPKQKEFIDNFIQSDDLFGVVSAPRGSGKTLLGINLMLYWLLSKPNKKGGWISPVYSQAKNVYDTLTQTSSEVITASNRMEMVMTLINGSTLKFLSGDSPDSIRGFRFSHLVIDEMAFIKERTIDQVVLPTLNPQGKKALMISTPKSKNHFYSWYMKDSTYSMRFPLTECPYIQQDLIDADKSSLPPDIFRQEFLAEFVDSVNDVFVGIDRVSYLGKYEEGRGQDAYVGIDTGLVDDYSVLYCLSPIGKTLHIERINNENINTIATVFSNIMSTYNVVGGYIETNGIGKGMYDLISPKFRKIKPFTTTQKSKSEAVRKLINDIELTNIELPSDNLSPELHQEFSNYTYKMSPTGNLSFGHSPGSKDDIIDALLMANLSRVKFMERRPMRVGSIGRVKPSFGRPK